MILVINPGSSSLKYKLFDVDLNVIQEDNLALKDNVTDCALAVNQMLDNINDIATEIEKIAIRVVHGGPEFNEVTQVTDKVLLEIEKYSILAPLHNPQALDAIKVLSDRFDQSKIYAVFDTGYFNSLPKEAKTFPIGQIDTPIQLKRYGFHGISHKFMKEEIDSGDRKRIVTIHLGSGCSISAINNGQVVATSMGLTPDEGLIMQKRSGDLDPGLVLYLVDAIGLEETRKLIEEESGLAGLTGTSGSMVDILILAGEEVTGADHGCEYEITAENKEKSILALNIYSNKIVQYIGGYAALMGGLDAVVFSGKIGANSAVVRRKVMSGLEFLGDIEIKIVEPNEELAMAREVIK